MPFKAVVELQIHAVTCPGVFLPEKDDIFLNVSIMGHSKETNSLPAIFPLLFHEKMRFEKVFRKATDPATVAKRLENHVARFELIQLTHSAGDVLAVYEENSREFLFPEPKLTPPYPGVDREVLMKTVPGYPGIAPKIEFSTRTTIKEKTCDLKKKCHADKPQTWRSFSNSPCKQRSSQRKNGFIKSLEKQYDRATRSSASRSPSPYTQRRMCELNKDNQQRLANLNLGNSEFKSDTEKKPPFIVRHVDRSKPIGGQSSPQLKSPKTENYSSTNVRFSELPLRRALSFDSFQDEIAEKDFLDERSPSRKSTSFDYSGKTQSFPFHYNTNSQQGGSTRSTLRERLKSEQGTWEEIHSRVCSLLRTHRAKQRLSSEISKNEADQIIDRAVYSRRSPNNSYLEQRF
ncbi:spermatogenesis associated 6-like protein [Pelodytes ibericus]